MLIYSVQFSELFRKFFIKIGESWTIIEKRNFEMKLQSRENVRRNLAFLNSDWIPKVQKCVNLVDLIKSCQTSISI